MDIKPEPAATDEADATVTRLPKNNPRTLSLDDAMAIYQAAL